MLNRLRDVLISAHRAVSAALHIGGLAPLLKARGEGFQSRGNIFHQGHTLRVIGGGWIALLRRGGRNAALASGFIQFIR